jgi:hypothetical protein
LLGVHLRVELLDAKVPGWHVGNTREGCMVSGHAHDAAQLLGETISNETRASTVPTPDVWNEDDCRLRAR